MSITCLCSFHSCALFEDPSTGCLEMGQEDLNVYMIYVKTILSVRWLKSILLAISEENPLPQSSCQRLTVPTLKIQESIFSSFEMLGMTSVSDEIIVEIR